MKFIVQVITSLENTGILLKGTTEKVSQKGGLLNFLAPFKRISLLIMKSALAPLAKTVGLGLTAPPSAAPSGTYSAIQKEIFWSKTIRLFYKQSFFSTQRQCCLTFS